MFTSIADWLERLPAIAAPVLGNDQYLLSINLILVALLVYPAFVQRRRLADRNSSWFDNSDTNSPNKAGATNAAGINNKRKEPESKTIRLK